MNILGRTEPDCKQLIVNIKPLLKPSFQKKTYILTFMMKKPLLCSFKKFLIENIHEKGEKHPNHSYMEKFNKEKVLEKIRNPEKCIQILYDIYLIEFFEKHDSVFCNLKENYSKLENCEHMNFFPLEFHFSSITDLFGCFDDLFLRWYRISKTRLLKKYFSQPEHFLKFNEICNRMITEELKKNCISTITICLPVSDNYEEKEIPVIYNKDMKEHCYIAKHIPDNTAIIRERTKEELMKKSKNMNPKAYRIEKHSCIGDKNLKKYTEEIGKLKEFIFEHESVIGSHNMIFKYENLTDQKNSSN